MVGPMVGLSWADCKPSAAGSSIALNVSRILYKPAVDTDSTLGVMSSRADDTSGQIAPTTLGGSLSQPQDLAVRCVYLPPLESTWITGFIFISASGTPSDPGKSRVYGDGV